MSTCDVMEWVRDNGCPLLDYTHFDFDDSILKGCFVVSSMHETEETIESTIELYGEPNTWHEPIQGGRRVNIMPYMWVFWIDGKYYFMTGG